MKVKYLLKLKVFKNKCIDTLYKAMTPIAKLVLHIEDWNKKRLKTKKYKTQKVDRLLLKNIKKYLVKYEDHEIILCNYDYVSNDETRVFLRSIKDLFDSTWMYKGNKYLNNYYLNTYRNSKGIDIEFNRVINLCESDDEIKVQQLTKDYCFNKWDYRYKEDIDIYKITLKEMYGLNE